MRINMKTLVVLVTLIPVLIGCSASREMQTKQGRVHRDIGEAYLAQGNYTAALKELLAAEALTPEDPLLQNYLGLVYRARGRLVEARRHFEQAVALKPDFAPARNNLGEVMLAQQDWDAAITIFEELALDLLYSTPHYAAVNLGWAYYNKGQYVVALKYYRQALRHYQDGFNKDFTYIKTLRGLATTHDALGDFQTAETRLNEALALTPNFAPLYLDLARILVKQNRPADAIAACRQVLALSPDTRVAEEAKELLARLQTGS